MACELLNSSNCHQETYIVSLNVTCFLFPQILICWIFPALFIFMLSSNIWFLNFHEAFYARDLLEFVWWVWKAIFLLATRARRHGYNWHHSLTFCNTTSFQKLRKIVVSNRNCCMREWGQSALERSNPGISFRKISFLSQRCAPGEAIVLPDQGKMKALVRTWGRRCVGKDSTSPKKQF